MCDRDERHLAESAESLDLSVVVCTYNRADLLARTLASIARAEQPGDRTWELLVVDNRSTDHTVDVVADWSDRLPIRYLYEPEPGLSAARNRAVAEARGRLMAFTDDDVEVDTAWLCELATARRAYPTAAYLAGKILPSYENTRPRWMTEACEALLAGVVIKYSPRRQAGVLSAGESRPMGANLAFDTEALRAIGGFRTDLGRNGSSLVGGEEVAAMIELERRGHHGVYVPGAIVHHLTPVSRLRRGFLFRYFTAVGIAAVRMGQVEPANRIGPPRWMPRKLLGTGLALAWSCLTGPGEDWIRRMRGFGFYLGAIWELLRTAPHAPAMQDTPALIPHLPNGGQ